MYRLIFLTGKSRGKRLAISDKSVTVGRDVQCRIQLPDDEVSRQHAVFEQREDGVYVRDLGATNEILINGVPTREGKLKSGDKIELGKTVLQYQEMVTQNTVGMHTENTSQGITAAIVLAIIAVQLIFLFILAISNKDVLTVPEEAEKPVATVPKQKEEKKPAVPLREKKQEPSVAKIDTPKHGQPPHEKAPSSTKQEKKTSASAQDIRKLKKDVADLRQQVEGMTQPEAKPAANAKPVDPLTKRAQEMLANAALEIKRSNYIQADRQLARIQLMAPDFVPAYIERAHLFEKRGMTKQAGEQWSEVLKRSMGTPLYEEAAAERIRLARADMVRKTTEAKSKPATRPGRLPRRIRIADVQQERFPESDQFEEMRLLRITLKPGAGERDIESYQIQVAVTFFDEEAKKHTIQPTRAVVPKDTLRVDGDWRTGRQRVVTAAYIVPRGFREQERQQHEQNMLYLGYVVQVYYRQELQDAVARPKTLLKKMNEIPSPFHRAKQKKNPNN